jgi:hypothetical protein
MKVRAYIIAFCVHKIAIHCVRATQEHVHQREKMVLVRR